MILLFISMAFLFIVGEIVIMYDSLDNILSLFLITPYVLIVSYFLIFAFSKISYLVYKEFRYEIIKKKGDVGTARVVDIDLDHTFKARNPKNFRYYVTFEFANKDGEIIKYNTGMVYDAHQVAYMIKKGEVNVFILNNSCALKGRLIGTKNMTVEEVVNAVEPFVREDIRKEKMKYKLFNSSTFILLSLSCLIPVVFTFIYELYIGSIDVTYDVFISMLISYGLFLLIYSIGNIYIKSKYKNRK